MERRRSDSRVPRFRDWSIRDIVNNGSVVVDARLRRTDETSSLSSVVFADSAQRLDSELGALKFADLELLRRDVVGSQ